MRRERLAQEAIALAQAGRWSEAAEANRQILAGCADDVGAWNRLGRALFALGESAGARAAYARALALDPLNEIARKNVERLRQPSVAPAPTPGRKVDPQVFVEYPGRTVICYVVCPPGAPPVAPGDVLKLTVTGLAASVSTERGEPVGTLCPVLAARLGRLIGRGNRYLTMIMGVEGGRIRLFIREVARGAGVAEPSFPPHLVAALTLEGFAPRLTPPDEPEPVEDVEEVEEVGSVDPEVLPAGEDADEPTAATEGEEPDAAAIDDVTDEEPGDELPEVLIDEEPDEDSED